VQSANLVETVSRSNSKSASQSVKRKPTFTHKRNLQNHFGTFALTRSRTPLLPPLRPGDRPTRTTHA
jgi:hypothetical protein